MGNEASGDASYEGLTAEELGVEIRLGTELSSFENSAESATSLLSDGTTETWDLIIVAEGIKSQTRAKLGIVEG